MRVVIDDCRYPQSFRLALGKKFQYVFARTHALPYISYQLPEYVSWISAYM